MVAKKVYMVCKVYTKPYTWCTKWSIWPQILANESSTSFNISNAISLSNTFPFVCFVLERNSFFCRLWNLFVFFISLPFSIYYDLDKCSYHFICVWLIVWYMISFVLLCTDFHFSYFREIYEIQWSLIYWPLLFSSLFACDRFANSLMLSYIICHSFPFVSFLLLNDVSSSLLIHIYFPYVCRCTQKKHH